MQQEDNAPSLNSVRRHVSSWRAKVTEKNTLQAIQGKVKKSWLGLG